MRETALYMLHENRHARDP